MTVKHTIQSTLLLNINTLMTTNSLLSIFHRRVAPLSASTSINMAFSNTSDTNDIYSALQETTSSLREIVKYVLAIMDSLPLPKVLALPDDSMVLEQDAPKETSWGMLDELHTQAKLILRLEGSLQDLYNTCMPICNTAELVNETQPTPPMKYINIVDILLQHADNLININAFINKILDALQLDCIVVEDTVKSVTQN